MCAMAVHSGERPQQEEAKSEETQEPGTAAGEVQEELRQVAEEMLLWKQNAPLLYNRHLQCSLTWPAFSVAWLTHPEEDRRYMAVGMRTDGSAKNEIVVVSITDEDTSHSKEWRRWRVRNRAFADDGICTGIGFGTTGNKSPLQVVQQFKHPTEANKIVPCPYHWQVFATRPTTGGVLLWNWHQATRPGRPELFLTTPGSECDGMALGWSAREQGLLAAGGSDGVLHIWDINGQAKPLRTITSKQAHPSFLNDLSFSKGQSCLLATVSDNGELALWDARAHVCATRLHYTDREALSVDFSPDGNWIASAGRDNQVSVWDPRKLLEPWKALRGHEGAINHARWSPYHCGLLASGSEDSRVVLWDINRDECSEVEHEPGQEGDDVEEEPPVPELLFDHRGHHASINDCCWSTDQDFMLCSVCEENTLAIWRPRPCLWKPSAKRWPECHAPEVVPLLEPDSEQNKSLGVVNGELGTQHEVLAEEPAGEESLEEAEEEEMEEDPLLELQEDEDEELLEEAAEEESEGAQKMRALRMDAQEEDVQEGEDLELQQVLLQRRSQLRLLSAESLRWMSAGSQDKASQVKAPGQPTPPATEGGSVAAEEGTRKEPGQPMESTNGLPGETTPTESRKRQSEEGPSEAVPRRRLEM